MLYLNQQNTQLIIALNSYLSAVLLIPKHLKFHSNYFRVKLIQVRQTLYIFITRVFSTPWNAPFTYMGPSQLPAVIYI